MFAHWGVPSEVMTDNGTQFTSAEFQDFAKTYEFEHKTSSPHYPLSNGEAERAVQTSKKILDQPDPWLALMIYRATPIANLAHSPSQLMMGRQIRTTLPILPQHLSPKQPEEQKIRQADQQAKQKNALYYNRGTKPLSQLSPGDSIRMRTKEGHWSDTGTVLEKHSQPRSYIVQQGDGIYRRNRSHLQVQPDSATNNQPETVPSDGTCVQQTPERAPAPPPDPSTPTPTTPVAVRRSHRTKNPPAWMSRGEYDT